LSIGGAFEFLLAEWHITPDYIVNNWTDELLNLMIEKLTERKGKESKAMKSTSSDSGKVSDDELLAKMGIKVVKK